MKKLQVACLLFFIGLMTMNAQDWHHDINDAKQEAEAKNRPIVLVFKGSDWCAPCIKLDREVFEKDFRHWLDDHPNLPMSKKELNDFLEARKAKNP